MKVSTIVIIATVFAVSGSLAYATAKAKHHHHHEMHGITTGMGSGRSGPRTDAGGVDKSRVGGQGVSRKPAGE